MDDYPDLVILQSTNTITAFNNPKYTQQFASKAVCATITTCRVFELLEAAGVKTAYKEQLTPTEFLASRCEMIPLEVIARREAVGSFLKRYPQYAPDSGDNYRFDDLKIEFFLKTSHGQFLDRYGDLHVMDLTPEQDDPFIFDAHANEWDLRHPGKVIYTPESKLKIKIPSEVVIGHCKPNVINDLRDTTKKSFMILESAFEQQGLVLVDFKIEFGVTTEGEVVVADVIDNDSWRLRDWYGIELSKEAFRQGENLTSVERKYALVTEKVQNFSIPKQTLVILRCSESGSEVLLPADFPNNFIAIENIVCPEKSCTECCQDKLNKILKEHTEGGIIIVKAHCANGLCPMLAVHQGWIIINVSDKPTQIPRDLWGKFRMPSGVPVISIWENDAINYAINIFAQTNPALYMYK